MARPYLIWVYGSWGAEPHSSKDSLDAAAHKALELSKRNPENEYSVELDPGGPDSLVFRAGKPISRGAHTWYLDHGAEVTSSQKRDAPMKRAYHYVAKIQGSRPVRFYTEGRQTPVTAAAYAFGRWARTDAMTLWPTEKRGVYRAQWFDKYSDTFRETELTILEEQAIGQRDPKKPKLKKFLVTHERHGFESEFLIMAPTIADARKEADQRMGFARYKIRLASRKHR